MDGYEATKIVFSRIQSLDPDNASKIMGLLLIQDHGEKEMIRLAFGPEILVQSLILKAKKELGLLSNIPSTPSTPSSPSPFNSHLSLSRHNSSSPSGSSRLLCGVNLPSPLSMPNHHSSVAPTPRGNSSFSDFQIPEDLVIPSPSSVPYGAATSNGMTNLAIGSISSSMNSSAPPFYGGGGETNLIDEFLLQGQLSFLNDGSPTQGPKGPEFFYPQTDLTSSPCGSGEGMLFPTYGAAAAANWGGSVNGLPHRRSFSVSDISLGSEDPAGGFGWKPCLYFARGYCKNGTSCKFLHGGVGEAGMPEADCSAVGSPSKFEIMDQCQELTRSKSLKQQRLVAASSQFMASGNIPYSPVAANKCMNFLFQQQQLQADNPTLAAALMMNEDMHKFGRSRLDKNDFVMNGSSAMMNTASRQIYLTFPSDSTFKEEDVSNYFSNYGPVQDVRIPYQQKRMFGFVTFVYPESVKLILAKGNPHFVCDARVLVKPYKEKGKIPDKFRKQQQLQQQLERIEFGGCGSPTGLDSRDPFDLGTRVFHSTQDMRRKLEEQADLQQVIQLQNRRLMSLQLDVKRNNHHRTFSTGSFIPSSIQSPSFFVQSPINSSDRGSPEVTEENGSGPVMSSTTATFAADQRLQKVANLTEKEKQSSTINEGNGSGKDLPHKEDGDFPESLVHNLPDNPFASPKATGDYTTTAFSAGEPDKNATPSLPSLANGPTSSSLDITPLRSCYFQAPSLQSGHGAMGM